VTPSAGVAAGVGAVALPLLAQASNETGPLAHARLSICGATVAAAAVYDLHERRIPNRLTLPAAVICLALTIVGGSRVADLAVGLVLVTSLMVISFAVPAAFGMGDIKLMLLVVVGLDAHATRALTLGLLIAAAVGVILMARHGRAAGRRALPLAPFIAAGTLLALLP
jgi:Flp pilus assembly protein protease CpaA